MKIINKISVLKFDANYRSSKASFCISLLVYLIKELLRINFNQFSLVLYNFPLSLSLHLLIDFFFAYITAVQYADKFILYYFKTPRITALLNGMIRYIGSVLIRYWRLPRFFYSP